MSSMSGVKRQAQVWLREKNPRVYEVVCEIYRTVGNPRGAITRLAGHNLRLRVGKNIMEVPGDLWWAYWHGDYYEKNVTYWLERLLLSSRSRVFYDVGASYGYYSLKLAEIASHIYAFEPVCQTFHILRKNIEENGLTNVTPYKLGLSNRVGNAEINIFNQSGNNSLFRTDTGIRKSYVAPRRLLGQQTIRLTTLDELIQDLSLTPPDLIKMDIEGGELDALRGARRTIETYQPILLIEYDSLLCQAAGYASSDLLADLEVHGYRVYGIPEYERDLTIHSKARFDDIEVANIVAVPRSMERLPDGMAE